MLSVCCIIRFRREKGMIDFLTESTWEILRTRPSRISSWVTIWWSCVHMLRNLRLSWGKSCRRTVPENWADKQQVTSGDWGLRYPNWQSSQTQTANRCTSHNITPEKILSLFFQTPIAQTHQDDKVQALEKVRLLNLLAPLDIPVTHCTRANICWKLPTCCFPHFCVYWLHWRHKLQPVQ